MNSKLFRKVVGFALILAFVFVVAGTSPQTAQAASFTVNSTLDAVYASPGDGICASWAGVCKLRAAIQEASALAGADTINSPAGTYTLSLAGVEDDNNLTGDLDIISTGGPLTI